MADSGWQRLCLFFGATLSAAAAGWYVTWGGVVASTDPPQSRSFWIGVTWLATAGLLLGLVLVALGEVGLPKDLRRRTGVAPVLSSSPAPAMPTFEAPPDVSTVMRILRDRDVAAGDLERWRETLLAELRNGEALKRGTPHGAGMFVKLANPTTTEMVDEWETRVATLLKGRSPRAWTQFTMDPPRPWAGFRIPIKINGDDGSTDRRLDHRLDIIDKALKGEIG